MDKKVLLPLLESRLFNHLKERELLEIFGSFHPLIREFRKGQILKEESTPYKSLIFILEGSFSADISNPEGQQITIEILEAPQEVALGILFATVPLLPVALTGFQPGLYIEIPSEKLLRMAQRDRGILLKILNASGDKVQFLNKKLRSLKLLSLEQRVLDYIIKLPRRDGFVSLPYSLEKLAELFAVSRPSLSRTIASLVEKGVLQREGKLFKIGDGEETSPLLS